MTKEDLAGVPYLSCVENYFLAWYQKARNPAELYGECLRPFAEVLRDFVVCRANYASYDKIPRVQNLAKKYGIVASEARKGEIPCLKKDDLLLLKVGETYLQGQKISPWREDHYVCVTGKKGEEFCFLDQYPLREGRAPLNLLVGRDEEIFMLRYALTGGGTLPDFSAPAAQVWRKEPNAPLPELTAEAGIPLRNALAVYKVIARRAEAFYRDFCAPAAKKQAGNKECAAEKRVRKVMPGDENKLSAAADNAAEKRASAAGLPAENKERSATQAQAALSKAAAEAERAFASLSVAVARGKTDAAAMQSAAERVAALEEEARLLVLQAENGHA